MFGICPLGDESGRSKSFQDALILTLQLIFLNKRHESFIGLYDIINGIRFYRPIYSSSDIEEGCCLWIAKMNLYIFVYKEHVFLTCGFCLG